ncbi:chromate reductase [Streptosporangium becharense]|uniref:Chromate reductase n=1 Tax=Streptosporangium becharense TaxID=1816182 RepID=A0A7W9MKG8_9ACTN|nr:NAD(P)H-dependent oxidoreductase [Streptosporangium becharense]MBB2914484.1 chromate reductase [Streptosporangium becharense]MBB5823484.1 chromate reductase [Streptosporangium becharense]
MKIIGIAGGLRSGAYVRRLLKAASRELPATTELTIWEGLDRVPPLTDGTLPRAVDELCHALAGADGMLITAPGHSSLPAQLGYALDWVASRRAGAVLVGKPVGLVTACSRPHEATWTQIQLGRALGAAGAVVYGTEVVVSPAPSHFDADGRLTDPTCRARIRHVLEEIASRVPARSGADTALSHT